MSSYRAEYIWIDGSEPTQFLTSKTKVIPEGESPSVWGFDGSSTNRAVGSDSDCVLNPVYTCPDPLRSEDDTLVLCEVLNIDMSPHKSNHRANCVDVFTKYS